MSKQVIIKAEQLNATHLGKKIIILLFTILRNLWR